MKTFAVALACVFLIPLAAVGGYLVNSDPAPAKQPEWIYGPQRKLTTAKEDVVVLCQGKTNSRAFANRERAVPGDVVVDTCRAVRITRATT